MRPPAGTLAALAAGGSGWHCPRLVLTMPEPRGCPLPASSTGPLAWPLLVWGEWQCCRRQVSGPVLCGGGAVCTVGRTLPAPWGPECRSRGCQAERLGLGLTPPSPRALVALLDHALHLPGANGVSSTTSLWELRCWGGAGAFLLGPNPLAKFTRRPLGTVTIFKEHVLSRPPREGRGCVGVQTVLRSPARVPSRRGPWTLGRRSRELAVSTLCPRGAVPLLGGEAAPGQR